ncbi:N/A [soil metagenome]
MRPSRSPIIAFRLSDIARGLITLAPELRLRALRLAKNEALADDLVQDTVERALRFAGQYELGTNLRAWSFQILFSVFVTRYRRQRRERNALRDLATDPNAWTQPECFSGPDRTADLTTRTQKKLDALPEGFRAVVRLVDIEERSYREAADHLGVPVGTVMSRLHRGRKLLAQEFELEAA